MSNKTKMKTASDYDREFVQNLERVLAHVAVNAGGDVSECFPPTLLDGYANTLGDGIVARCVTEMAEGNEPDPGEAVPTDVQIAAHSITLMERVRDDIDHIIATLEDYTPAKADAALVELRSHRRE